MKEKWIGWIEPMQILLKKHAENFIGSLLNAGALDDFPKRGKLVEIPEIYTCKEELAKAFSGYLAYNAHCTTDFLEHYVYLTSVYEDVYGLVFEYIGEHEHQMDLHGDEFAQSEVALVEDFALYIANWPSSYIRKT